MRLYLEGPNCNRLAIHLQHLSSIPSILRNSDSSWKSEWQGSEDSESGYFESVQWKSYSSICTSAVKHNPAWLQRVPNGVFVITGAQLVTKGNWSKKVLHLRLQYMHIPNCTIQKTEWASAPATSQKGSFLTNLSTTLSAPFTTRDAHPPPKNEPAQLNSGVYPDGPPMSVQSRKLLKFVDMTEVVRGPHNVPGHWLATAAKLAREGGKIALHVKFALLNYSAEPEANWSSYTSSHPFSRLKRSDYRIRRKKYMKCSQAVPCSVTQLVGHNSCWAATKSIDLTLDFPVITKVVKHEEKDVSD